MFHLSRKSSAILNCALVVIGFLAFEPRLFANEGTGTDCLSIIADVSDSYGKQRLLESCFENYKMPKIASVSECFSEAKKAPDANREYAVREYGCRHEIASSGHQDTEYWRDTLRMSCLNKFYLSLTLAECHSYADQLLKPPGEVRQHQDDRNLIYSIKCDDAASNRDSIKFKNLLSAIESVESPQECDVGANTLEQPMTSDNYRLRCLEKFLKNPALRLIASMRENFKALESNALSKQVLETTGEPLSTWGVQSSSPEASTSAASGQ